MSNITRSEPSNKAFEADEWIGLLSQQEQESNGSEQGHLFGVVVVANWPPKESIMRPYSELLPKIKTYFDPEDYAPLCQHKPPAVYFYPPQTLHITIATFCPFTAPEISDRDEYSRACKTIMESAFARQDWPNKPFSIEIERVNVGCKAAIFLWENKDGTIGTMRKIIQEEYDKFSKKNPASLNHRDLIVPGIIHSSFIRFGRAPKTNRVHVQQKFEEDAQQIKDHFGKVQVDSVRLAVERIPYMHIPFDDKHVLTSFQSSVETKK